MNMLQANQHKSVRSEDSGRAKPFVEAAVLPAPLSAMESVPGYAPQAMGDISRGGRAPVLSRQFMLRQDHPAVSASLASFGTRAHPEIVIGDDDRRAVPEPTQSPWRHICALRIVSASGKEYVGTGWFAGPYTILTAGHCVYLHDDGGWAESI